MSALVGVIMGSKSDWSTLSHTADMLEKLGFASGSMGPKVEAACEFARKAGKTAVIGALADIEAIVQGKAGTRVSTEKPGITYF